VTDLLRKSKDLPTDRKVRVLKLKGNKPVVVRCVEAAAKSLSQEGGVFVIDDSLHNTIWIWSSQKANKMEKTKSLDIASRVNRNEHGGKFQVQQLTAGDAPPAEFWAALPGSAADIGTEDPSAALTATPLTFYTLSLEENASSATIERAPENTKLERKILFADGAHVIDTTNEVYLWLGKEASKDLKEAALVAAQQLFDAATRPSWASLERVTDRGELIVFTELFASWDEKSFPRPRRMVAALAAAQAKQATTPPGSPSPAATTTAPSTPPASPQPSKASESVAFDAKAMHTWEPPASATKHLPDGDGRLTIWYVDNMEKKEVPKETYGHFLSNKSYIGVFPFALLFVSLFVSLSLYLSLSLFLYLS